MAKSINSKFMWMHHYLSKILFFFLSNNLKNDGVYLLNSLSRTMKSGLMTQTKNSKVIRALDTFSTTSKQLCSHSVVFTVGNLMFALMLRVVANEMQRWRVIKNSIVPYCINLLSVWWLDYPYSRIEPWLNYHQKEPPLISAYSIVSHFKWFTQ